MVVVVFFVVVVTMSFPQGTRPAGIDWMRKLANRYQRIREVYKDYACNVGALLSGSEGGPEEWLKLRQKLEEATDKWLTHAQMCIELINQRHVLLAR